MNGLYLMVTITDRNMARRFIALYESEGVSVSFTALGSGTAINETLDYFGLARSQKAVMLSTVTHDVWQAVKARLQSELKIDIPGIGIAFIIPLSSIGGKKQLFFLTDGQKFEKGEESELKNTKYELLLAITNQGHTDTVMDAAREAKASGGTVIHAKGTGTERARKVPRRLYRRREGDNLYRRQDRAEKRHHAGDNEQSRYRHRSPHDSFLAARHLNRGNAADR